MKPSNLIKVPLIRQSNSYSCGVSALQSVLAYYNFKNRQDKLSEELNCTPETGTPNWEMVRYCREKGFDANSYLEYTIEDVEKNINRGIPVIVALQAWAEDNRDYTDTWDHGHYAVIIGYDDENFYFMDPSTLGNYTYISKSEFVNRWHDVDQNHDEVIHLAVVIESNSDIRCTDPLEFTKLQ